MADSIQAPSNRVFLSNGEQDIDRLSDLPDAVLCHILSFLPTKISVATSVLSKRWTNLWRTVPALSFSSTEFTDGFIDHVYKVLAMFQTQTIYQFTLHFEPTPTVDALHIYPWILTALERNVQKLNLNFGTTPGQLVRLPSPIFACETLVCLKLFDATLMDIPANVCLPSLKILQAERVYYPNEGCFTRLLSGSPILEELIIQKSRDNVLVLDVNVPSLKRITVKRPSSQIGFYKLLIKAPMLETIKLFGLISCDIRVGDLSNLVEATVHIDIPYNEGVIVLFKEIGNIMFLSLSDYTFMSMCFQQPFPKFCNLVKLEITTCCEFWHVLVALLRSVNNLMALLFHINVPSYHKGRKCDNSLPMIAPRCVSASLETLKVTGVCKQKCSWKFVRYVLKNAEVLKEMKIWTSLSLKNRSSRLKNLLEYPRASAACEIDFFLDSSAQDFHL
ncbi:hypothetical protein V6N13_079212 [Hibiscus sabdariffa]